MADDVELTVRGKIDREAAIVAKPVHIFGLDFCWWGWGEWHKWRWHGMHIDLGPLSIYGIRRPHLWLPLAWAIKPMRWAYHRRFR